MNASTPCPAIDSRRAIDLVLELMAIPGASGDEAAVAEFVRQRLLSAGAPPAAIRFDKAHRRSPLGGKIGNLILKLPGTHRGPRRMLSAHMDTVPICVGCRPVRNGDLATSATPNTGLGGDDRSGVGVLLTVAQTILAHKLPHPPLTFVWFVQEEVGLMGARHVDVPMLGRPKLAFNFDGGSPHKLTIGATGGYRLDIAVSGRASHAGGAPEEGVSAIAIASLAIADLHKNGWHGLIRKRGPGGRERAGTSNVGVIHGGTATNVVADRVDLRAEARSHDPAFRKRIVREIERAFQRAARAVKNVRGERGRVEFAGELHYESFRLRPDEPVVVAAEQAIRGCGGEPELAISNGGLDANWLTAHGIPTVTLGCGQLHIHTTAEQLDLKQFVQACQIGMQLATATVNPR